MVKVRDFSSPPRVIDWDLVGEKRIDEERHAILRDPENRSRMYVPVSMLVETGDPSVKHLATTTHE